MQTIICGHRPIHAHIFYYLGAWVERLALLSSSRACVPQIANSWGQKVDKLPFEGRRSFVEDNLELILDSAERPLDGKGWAFSYLSVSVL
jgi:hypothetical protein